MEGFKEINVADYEIPLLYEIINLFIANVEDQVKFMIREIETEDGKRVILNEAEPVTVVVDGCLFKLSDVLEHCRRIHENTKIEWR